MTNKERILEAVKREGMELGIYHKEMEELTYYHLKKVLDNFDYGSTDIKVKLNKVPYIVEVYHVDNEVDFMLISQEKYIKRYGRNI